MQKQKEFIAKIAGMTGLKKKVTKDILMSVPVVIRQELATMTSVRWMKFGIIEPMFIPPKTERLVKTGERKKFPARYRTAFKWAANFPRRIDTSSIPTKPDPAE